jgi:hypothetical protein
MREKGWIMTVELTDAQLVTLRAAAQREDHCLTAPDKMKGAILAKVGEKLVKLGLAREVRAKAGRPVRRRGDVGQSYGLKLTAAGLRAIAVDDGSDETVAVRDALQPNPNSDPTGRRAKTTPRADSKLARVIDLLQRSDGATIASLMEATGWLPHTNRAALTGLRKRGYAVVRERIEGHDSVYRIVGRPTDGEDHSGAEAGASDDYDRERTPKRSRVA